MIYDENKIILSKNKSILYRVHLLEKAIKFLTSLLRKLGQRGMMTPAIIRHVLYRQCLFLIFRKNKHSELVT